MVSPWLQSWQQCMHDVHAVAPPGTGAPHITPITCKGRSLYKIKGLRTMFSVNEFEYTVESVQHHSCLVPHSQPCSHIVHQHDCFQCYPRACMAARHSWFTLTLYMLLNCLPLHSLCPKYKLAPHGLYGAAEAIFWQPALASAAHCEEVTVPVDWNCMGALVLT